MAIENYEDLTLEEKKTLAMFKCFGRNLISIADIKQWLGPEVNVGLVHKSLQDEGLAYPFSQNIGGLHLSEKGMALADKTNMFQVLRFKKEFELRSQGGGYFAGTTTVDNVTGNDYRERFEKISPELKNYVEGKLLAQGWGWLKGEFVEYRGYHPGFAVFGFSNLPKYIHILTSLDIWERGEVDEEIKWDLELYFPNANQAQLEAKYQNDAFMECVTPH